MTAHPAIKAFGHHIKTSIGDVVTGFFKLTRHGLTLLGAAAIAGVAMLAAQPEWRQHGETLVTNWVNDRQAAQAEQQVAELGITPEPDAVVRATAVDPADLTAEQKRVAMWISNKYSVAPEPIAALVAEAYEVGKQNGLEPTLILAIMANESSFNPFAQSPVGAQGLMQVMTRIHSDKYQYFGGNHAAFDPRTNLRVGVKVLRESISRGGSLAGGLKHYVGAANLPTDGGYGAKVMAEFARMYQAAKGKPLPASINNLRASDLPPVQAPESASLKVAALS